MRFELEEIYKDNIWICRGYNDYTPYYFAVCVVKRNNDGLYESCGWLSKKGTEPRYHREAVLFLMSKGWEVAFHFEKDKFHLYKRLFRPVGELEIIKEETVNYNGNNIEFYYGKIIPRGKDGNT